MDEKREIEKLKKGDISGLEALVQEYYVPAVRTAYLITRDKDVSEDVVQTTFIRVYEKIHQYDIHRPFKAWFLRSVVNEALNTAKQHSRDISLEQSTSEEHETLLQLLQDPQPGPEQIQEQTELRQKIWETLGKLSPALRASIVQRYYLELSEEEMSQKEGIAPGTVKWRLHTARERLRKLISSEGSSN